MNSEYSKTIARELGVSKASVEGVLQLLEEGATVPFIARYRKERTGEMDEEQIRTVRDSFHDLKALDDRRSGIRKSLEERDLLSKELDARIGSASTLSELEDIYLPFRPKRKTRASVARDRGLGPLAEALLTTTVKDPAFLAEQYIDPEAGVETAEDALAGARDIIAETISEDPQIRSRLRSLFERGNVSSKLKSKSKAAEAQVYRDYFEWQEPVTRAPAHRIHAILRGEREGFLTVHVEPEEERALDPITSAYVRYRGEQGRELAEACVDSYRRLLKPSLEGEQKKALKERADHSALSVFTTNLRDLLLAPPVGEKTVLGVDPGFRTGCKIVCLDPRGELLYNSAMYPLEPHSRRDEAAKEILGLIEKYHVEYIAVGNGTGGREAESFLRDVVSDRGIPVVSVNEAGASVYSASAAAREEFPDHDVTVRGAVSIGRRLMDPLSELVKIDPKAIGVGQYQHDVDQKLLEAGLTDTVVSCVNAVGVELNTASAWLLAYVSGLSRKAAEEIVGYRREKGPFKSRRELVSVRGIGEKVFQQAAGFLRIKNASNPLDASAVHPERYKLVDTMARSIGTSSGELIGNSGLVDRLELDSFVDSDVGLPTLRDIRNELLKPGRDPRSEFEAVEFRDDVREITDLTKGMKLAGIVTNVTNFGAFVDIGVHRDGLVHISKLADRFVSDPREVVKVNQRLEVTVIDIDVERKRINLSLID